MNIGMSEGGLNNDGQNTATAYPGMINSGNVPGGSLLQILWRGRWLLLLSVLLAAAGAYAYLRLATPMYESTARLLVDKPNPQLRSDAPQPAGSTLTNYLATQASMITSPEIIAAALRDPNVQTQPTFSDPNYVRELIGALSADVARKADIIQITASAPYPEDAARFVNALVRAYIQWHQANRNDTTRDLLNDFNAQLEKRSAEFRSKRIEQMALEKAYPEVLEGSPDGMIFTALETLHKEQTTARLKAVQCEAYYQGLNRLEQEPDAFREYVYSRQGQGSMTTTAVAATVVGGEQSERVRLQIELERTGMLLEEIQAAGPVQQSRLAMLQNRQEELKKRIADFDAEFARQQIVLAKTFADDARKQADQVTEIYKEELAKLQSRGDRDSRYAFLKVECKMAEDLYNTLLGQIDRLDLGARLENLKIYVLERAAPAEKPSSPRVAQVMGVGLWLGLMAGTGLSLLRNRRDQRVRSPDEITALLGVPILGAIPSVRRRVIRGGQKLWFAADSWESEACRAIRTALLCSTHRDLTKTLLVTSPGPQEGKTLVVSNLGAAMARVGLKTLVIDADLRKPLPQRIFTTNGHSKGLVEVLTGVNSLAEVIRHTDIDRLDVLEAGQSTSAPSELLSSPAFTTLLEQLKTQYDRILIDSPPMGVVTDAQILATVCDATVLVLRVEESSRVLTQRARDALHAVGARIAGAVVNDLSKRAGKYGYRSGYGSSPPPDHVAGYQATSPPGQLAKAGPNLRKEISDPEPLKE